MKKALIHIKTWLTKSFSLKKSLVSCGLSFLVFVLVFSSGALSSKTKDEVCADYYAEVSKDHTYDVGDKKLSGLVVEPKDGEDAKMRHDTDNAITEIWGIFKGENASFAPVMNANRTNEIRFVDSDFSNESLPLVYSNIGQSSEPYHIDKKTKETIDYKFQSSPIALMFQSANSGMQDKFHIYISQAQAERKLRSINKDITKQNLKDLQGSETQMMINGTAYDCIIDNIYLDNFEHSYHFSDYNYYYATDIGTIIGDFVFVILYANKANVFPENLKRQSLYVMSEYSFRNQLYLEYAKELYTPDKYSFDYIRTNLKDGFVPNYDILQTALKSTISDVWCVIITVIFFLTFAFNIFLIYFFKLFKQPLAMSMLAVSSIAHYLLFKLIFLITNNTSIFSSYSLTFNLILLAILAFTIIVLNCFGRELNMEAEQNV